MTKYTLKQEYPGYSGMHTSAPKETVTIEFEGDIALPQMLEKFETFLRGCGFYFDGHLELVDEQFPDWTGQPEETEDWSTEQGFEHSEYYFDTERNKPVR
jgi:hypothetical protein